MAIPAFAALASVPVILTMYCVGNTALALGLMLIPQLLNALWYGPVYATVQSVVSPTSRATAAAILFFVMNLIGLGLGPVCVGALNDVLAAAFGEVEGIRLALLLSALVILITAALFWHARDTVRSDIVS